ncbi:hypothetical protein EJ08DRAFT_341649 [Tothia fuscella]|uniref:NAD(P)-binding domain-containing protein n=1 Tax=Tothia fuscella TaxID=1048955 RepID=A0A9P4P2N7_9PEZI|nr:hypothetical protein EJ08DRAFT_341649 [Tothia fuscella]
MTSSQPTLAFFGATGGCAANALALALKDGYKVSALARTPSKLRTLLETEHKISPSTLDSNLTIIQGSIKDSTPVKQTLAPSNVPASIIVSGIGATPKFELSTTPIYMDDPHVVADGITTVLNSLRELRREGVISDAQKPMFCTISTTGISKNRDVPYAYYGLYHLALAIPHKDKKLAEQLVASAAMETGPEAPISGFVFPRPTLLKGGPAKGLGNIKAGWEKHPDALGAAEGESTVAAMGYSISRADVGLWIFENVIKGGRAWSGRCVSLTT